VAGLSWHSSFSDRGGSWLLSIMYRFEAFSRIFAPLVIRVRKPEALGRIWQKGKKFTHT
jgi:hypothetical protein